MPSTFPPDYQDKRKVVISLTLPAYLVEMLNRKVLEWAEENNESPFRSRSAWVEAFLLGELEHPTRGLKEYRDGGEIQNGGSQS